MEKADSNQSWSKNDDDDGDGIRRHSSLRCPNCQHKNTEARAYGIKPCFIQLACFDCVEFFTVTPETLFIIEIEHLKETTKRMGLSH